MSQPETTRLVTFETAENEMLVVAAGESEQTKRHIYSGNLNGRHALVPVEEQLQDSDDADSDGDPCHSEMQLVGQTRTVSADGESTVSWQWDGEQQRRMDREGTYGLLWIPHE